MTATFNIPEPVAELALEDYGIGDARRLTVNWLMKGYPPVGTKLYTADQLRQAIADALAKQQINLDPMDLNKAAYASMKEQIK